MQTLFLILSPFYLFIIHVLAQRLYFIKNPPVSQQMLVIRLVLIASLLNSLIYFLFWGSFLYAFVICLLLNGTYFHLFNMSETARRIRLMLMLYEDGKISSDVFQAKEYDPEKMVSLRIDRLVKMGSLIYDEKTKLYRARRRILLMAAYFFDYWRKLFYGKK